jgi:hypothetical protein
LQSQPNPKLFACRSNRRFWASRFSEIPLQIAFKSSSERFSGAMTTDGHSCTTCWRNTRSAGRHHFHSMVRVPSSVCHEHCLTRVRGSQQWTDVTGNVPCECLSRLDYQPLNEFGLWSIQEHFDSPDRHRSDVRRFEHEHIWIMDVPVTVVSAAPCKQPNVQPVSTTYHDPSATAGLYMPKHISIQCNENRHAEPNRRPDRTAETYGEGSQKGECACGVGEPQRA